jgi:hypothetical protein
VPILFFFIFVVAVVLFTLALGYSLSSFEGRSSTPRCRMPHRMPHRMHRNRMHRRRKTRKQRVRCRFEG